MKQGIHPDYHEITVVMTDGTKFKTRSTYGKEGEVLQLDVDPKTHPAWTGGGSYLNESASQVAKFNKKFGSIKLGGGQAATAPKAAEPKTAEPKASAAPAAKAAEPKAAEAKPAKKTAEKKEAK